MAQCLWKQGVRDELLSRPVPSRDNDRKVPGEKNAMDREVPGEQNAMASSRQHLTVSERLADIFYDCIHAYCSDL